jgi:MFS family permease
MGPNNADGQANVSIWSRNYVLLLIVNTVAYLSFQILMPLLPVYGLGFTASESAIGFLAASISIAALIIRPFSGVMADRGNRKMLILVTQLGTAAVILGFIAAANISILIGARFVHGILFGIGSTVITASAIQTIPEDKMGRGIGILSITGIGSQAIAPALGIYISEHWGYPVLFLFTAAVSAAAGLLVLALQPQKPVLAEQSRFSVKNIFAVESLGVAGTTLIFTMATSTITNFLVLFGNEREIKNIGLYFTIYAAVLIASRLFSGRIIDRYPFQNIACLCAALCTVGLAVIASSTQFSTLAIAAILMGLGYGVASPALQTEVIRRAGAERRGVASATFYIAMDLAYVVGPLSMGYIAEMSGYHIGFYVLCVPMAAAIPMAFLCSRTGKTRKDGKESAK